MSGERSADDKYRMFLRYRYNSCIEQLLENMGHKVYQVKVRQPASVIHVTAMRCNQHNDPYRT